MTNLTEKWKKGELPFGAYYVNRLEEHRVWLYRDRKQTCDNSYEIYEVLEKVPSYEEWQASEKYNKHLEEKIKIYERKDKQATETSIAYNELAEENKELKEILERHKKATAKAQIRSLDLEIINAQLKELVKECRDEIEYLRKHYKGSIDHFKNNTRLDKEINQVLGEE